VAEFLGARDLFLYSLPDNRFDQVPLLDVVKVVERLVSDLSPRIIYTHHSGDLNIDHTVTHRAVLTATRPVVGCPVKEIYAFEVPSSTEWAFQRLERPFTPNVFVDISATIEKKITGMEMYESEARVFPHPRSPEALRVIARRWGTVVGLEYAEAFELIRSVRIR
jgi:LmbE family N-acetylglucosaminyl deacetylase